MLTALVLLAAIEAVPSSTVSLTLTGDADRPPVSATPRSLSDVARELRAGRKAVGGFSAAESTVPQSRNVYVPVFEPEPETTEPEPEVVTEVQPVYVPTYLPAFFGGRQKVARHHHRIAAHPVGPAPASAAPGHLSHRSPFQSHETAAGRFRER